MKYYILIGLLLFTSLFSYVAQKRVEFLPKPALVNYFSIIPGYELSKKEDLSDEYVKMLDLDDYVFADYINAQGQVNLYIGYYYTAKKAYAAHSPLVCYVSQGWQLVGEPKNNTINIGSKTIEYEEIITTNGDVKELVLYWYQARMQTNVHVYDNKFDMGYNKLLHNDEQHGFVRVAVPFVNQSYFEVKERALAFVVAFYPVLCKFVLEGSEEISS